MEGRPEAAAAVPFADVSAETHCMDAIGWARENAIVSGYGNGTFGPEDALTREQMVTVLWHYAKYKGYDVSVGEDTNILSYADAPDISEYAISAMQWACGAGLQVGQDGTAEAGMYLNPKSGMTRAQLSVMLMRFGAWVTQTQEVSH